MIRVNVMYPRSDDVTFDHDYYRDKHIPLLQARLGDALQRAEIDKVLDGPYVAQVHLFFESMDAFQAGMNEHAGEFMADIPNYTNAQPVIMVSQRVT